MDILFFQEYYKFRMAEIYNRRSSLSYRVRINNAMSILLELNKVMKSWLKRSIKRWATVQLCIDECKDLLGKDEILEYPTYDKLMFLQDLENIFKDKNKEKDIPHSAKDDMAVSHLCFLVEEVIRHNSEKYLSRIINILEEILIKDREIDDSQLIPKTDRLESLISSFATELIRIGYSKSYLYKYYRAFRNNMKKWAFEDAWRDMVNRILSKEKKNFTVILNFKIDNFTLRAENSESSIVKIGECQIENIRQTLFTLFPNLKSNKSSQYFAIDIEAVDSTNAAHHAFRFITDTFDSYQDVLKGSQLFSTVYVILPRGDGKYNNWEEKLFVLDNIASLGASNTKSLPETFIKITNDNKIAPEVKDRIRSSLRHLRIGDNEVEMDQKFINYWIALEFLFSAAASDESSYSRIQQYLVTILDSIYVKRELQALNNWLVKVKYFGCNKEDWEDLKLDSLISSATNPLLKYRLRKYKSYLDNEGEFKKDKTMELINYHSKSLKRNIERIYRLRNELVHEGAIKHQEISNVTSQLRTYLVTTINLALSYFSDVSSECSQVDMNSFFWTYEKYDKMIKNKWNRQTLLEVPIGDTFVI